MSSINRRGDLLEMVTHVRQVMVDIEYDMDDRIDDIELTDLVLSARDSLTTVLVELDAIVYEIEDET